MKLHKITSFAAAAATLALSTSLGLAQGNAGGGQGGQPAQATQGGGGGNGGGGRRGGQGGQGGGNFDPAQFQQRMNERIKETLKATDEEWAVIQPLLEKVQTKQRDARAGGFGGGGMLGGGRRGQGGQGGQGAAPGAQQPADQNNQGNQQGRGNRGGGATSPEADALRTALENDSTSADDIKAKLTALRESRKKAQGELEQARADLEKVLTAKQEATLVLMGVLE
jgi:hypothetical protein